MLSFDLLSLRTKKNRTKTLHSPLSTLSLFPLSLIALAQSQYFDNRIVIGREVLIILVTVKIKKRNAHTNKAFRSYMTR